MNGNSNSPATPIQSGGRAATNSGGGGGGASWNHQPHPNRRNGGPGILVISYPDSA